MSSQLQVVCVEMPTEEDAVDVAGAYFKIVNNVAPARLPRIIRWWTRKFLVNHGGNLLSDFSLEDGSSFRNFTWMCSTDCELSWNVVKSKDIKETPTLQRCTVTAIIRLSVTLRYLATGDSYTSLQYTFKTYNVSGYKLVKCGGGLRW